MELLDLLKKAFQFAAYGSIAALVTVELSYTLFSITGYSVFVSLNAFAWSIIPIIPVAALVIGTGAFFSYIGSKLFDPE